MAFTVYGGREGGVWILSFCEGHKDWLSSNESEAAVLLFFPLRSNGSLGWETGYKGKENGNDSIGNMLRPSKPITFTNELDMQYKEGGKQGKLSCSFSDEWREYMLRAITLGKSHREKKDEAKPTHTKHEMLQKQAATGSRAQSTDMPPLIIQKVGRMTWPGQGQKGRKDLEPSSTILNTAPSRQARSITI